MPASHCRLHNVRRRLVQHPPCRTKERKLQQGSTRGPRLLDTAAFRTVRNRRATYPDDTKPAQKEREGLLLWTAVRPYEEVLSAPGGKPPLPAAQRQSRFLVRIITICLPSLKPCVLCDGDTQAAHGKSPVGKHVSVFIGLGS